MRRGCPELEAIVVMLGDQKWVIALRGYVTRQRPLTSPLDITKAGAL